MGLLNFLTHQGATNAKTRAHNAYMDFMEKNKDVREKVNDYEWLKRVEDYIDHAIKPTDNHPEKTTTIFLKYLGPFLTPQVLDLYLSIYQGLSLFGLIGLSIENIQISLRDGIDNIPLLILRELKNEKVKEKVRNVIRALDQIGLNNITKGDLTMIASRNQMDIRQVSFLHDPSKRYNSKHI
jgi:hypothetical protein